MANFFTTKGEILMPYDTEVFHRTLTACGGTQKPGCKFTCTMYASERRGITSLPCVFQGSYVELDEGVRIKYRVMPGLLVWIMMLLPMLVLAALLAMQVAVEFVGAFGILMGVVYFAYTYQRGNAIYRFEKRFGK